RSGSTELTYRELERKAAAITARLTGSTKTTGSYYGIYMESRLDTVAVMIGILNAGGVFIPMDTALPPKRIKTMIQVTGTGKIFTDEQSQKKLIEIVEAGAPPNTKPLQLIIINKAYYKTNAPTQSTTSTPSTPSTTSFPSFPSTPEDPIYIYFTSGTTGTPKAIIGKNKSLTQFIQWEKETFKVTPTYNISQLINTGFDPYLREIFTTLAAGATIVIPTDNQQFLEREKLVKWLEKQAITFIHCVPAVFSLFNTPGLTAGSYKNLKCISLSGEALSPHELKNWYRAIGEGVRIVNTYGPTEVTLIKMYHQIVKEDMKRTRLPVGKAIRGASVIILDKGKNVCDRGQVGEVYIRTPYLTHGYSNDPELTHQRYIPNPFGTSPHDQVYRTGDLARETPEGKIELLGRLDRQ
ncbi:MAG: amino acid adenylation domain-containing protein, partial [bacterium]|nr:amino acid adenylation domain-containing protein [bacterium]